MTEICIMAQERVNTRGRGNRLTLMAAQFLLWYKGEERPAEINFFFK